MKSVFLCRTVPLPCLLLRRAASKDVPSAAGLEVVSTSVYKPTYSTHHPAHLFLTSAVDRGDD